MECEIRKSAVTYFNSSHLFRYFERLTKSTFSDPLGVSAMPVLKCNSVFSHYSFLDLLRAGRSRDQIPVWAKFSAPVHTGPGAHPASCAMGTG
jgi:hypothetical protein